MKTEKRPRMVRLIVRLPPAVHELLRKESARQAVSMAALLRQRLVECMGGEFEESRRSDQRSV